MLKRLSFFFLFLIAPLTAEQARLSFRGHLDREAVASIQDDFEELIEGNPQHLLLEIESSSGDLKAVLNLAKAIYADKVENKRTITAYVRESAIGPAAMLPFLSDELATTTFVTWGDISLGSEEELPPNILRSRVRSLIAADHPSYDLLTKMAEAMSDEEVEFERSNVRAEEGEALVVDYNQLKRLGLITVQLRALPMPEKVERKASSASPEPKSSFEEQLAEHIKFNSAGSNKIGLIKIDDRTHGINQSTWIYVKAALDHYKLPENKPAFIILELNTPGGEVFSSQKISDALKEMDTNYGVPIVAHIDNWAISAGAMLAYSCRFITVVKDASMGAAEPVFQGEGGQMQTASEKINSALRTDFANRAGFFDRDPLLAMAMVDKDMLLVKRYGKIVKLDSEEEIRKTGLDPDEVISMPGKLLTLSSEEMMELGVADTRLLPERLSPITEEELTTGQWPASKSLLFTHPFFKEIPNATIDPVEISWQLEFLAFLAVPAVASVLFLGMMMGGYLEINSPGFGLPGTVALICFSLIVLSSFAMEAASWLELIMVLAGLGLIGLELFVLPGFGLPGFLGVILFVGGLFALMLPALGDVSYDIDGETFNAAGQEFMLRLTWLCGTVVVGLILIAVLARYVMPKMTFFRRLALVEDQEGYVASAHKEELPEVGAEGVVMATLRPSGKVEIGGSVYDAQSRGGFIEKGKAIIVAYIEGSKIVVKPKEQA